MSTTVMQNNRKGPQNNSIQYVVPYRSSDTTKHARKTSGTTSRAQIGKNTFLHRDLPNLLHRDDPPRNEAWTKTDSESSIKMFNIDYTVDQRGNAAFTF
jgi:hypothetical protein